MSRPPFPSLPPSGASTLLRALFKRPVHGQRSDIGATYLLDQIDCAHVERYKAAFGFAGDAIPLPYLYLLAQRAQLATMLARPAPFRIPGLIHVENTLAMHAPVHPGRALAITTTLHMQPPAPNGSVSALLETAAHEGERLAFECVSTYLVKRASKREGARPAQAPTPPGKPAGTWTLAHDAGRRYAALSGDWNPIHLWPWSARLMGMRTPIIHGAHTMAKACALLEQTDGRPVGSIACRFRSPVPLGSEVTLVAEASQGRFAAVCNGRVAMEGSAGFA